MAIVKRKVKVFIVSVPSVDKEKIYKTQSQADKAKEALIDFGLDACMETTTKEYEITL